MGLFKLIERLLEKLFGRKAVTPAQTQVQSSPQASKINVSTIQSRKPVGKKTLAAIVGAGAATILGAHVVEFEGMILRGYKDPIGIVTACAGHTKTAVLGRPYTIAECNNLLDQDLASHAAGVMACIKVPTTVGERAAYVSFGYNVGVGAFCGSTLVRKLNQGDYVGACNELPRWTKAGGKELKGLVRRRASEKELCLRKGARN